MYCFFFGRVQYVACRQGYFPAYVVWFGELWSHVRTREELVRGRVTFAEAVKLENEERTRDNWLLAGHMLTLASAVGLGCVVCWS
jgi:hypothetical protein